MTKNPLVGTSWLAVDGIENIEDIAVTAEFNEFTVSGSSGCNTYHAQYKIDGTQLRLSGPVAITRKMCPDLQMAVETEFLRQLNCTTTFRLCGDRLELAGEDGRLLLALQRISVDDLLGEWRVLSLHVPERKAIVSVSGGLYVNFDRSHVFGNSGCNTFQGLWSLKGKKMRIGKLATTSKECEEDIMTQEKAMLHALGAVESWRLTGEVLHLLRGDGGISLSLCRSEVKKQANSTSREGERE